jgi:predicted metal-dependent phosphoesterase TrpH
MFPDRTMLLAELHAHTTWSDGSLELPELVDLYGSAGFDVLCVTDHSVPGGGHVHARNHAAYLEAIDAEAERSLERFGMLVIPGLELTWDGASAADSAHAVAIGLREHVALDDGIEAAMVQAREAGAALIGAHPSSPGQTAGRGTERFAREPGWAASMVDRFELANRHDFFPWVADRHLPAVAAGDFHRPEHLATWKTALPCERDADEVVAFLRSGEPAHLVQAGQRTLAGR